MMINTNRLTRTAGWLGAASVGALLAGCNAPPAAPTSAPQPVVVNSEPFKPDVDAGIPIPQFAETDLASIASNRSYGGVRSDPFSLLPGESRYEASQRVERLLQDAGGYSIMFTPPPEETEVIQPLEPQPYRRLSGILVGDSVYAIIELEGGKTEIVRPGSQIPDSEWRIVSIDGEKAVLRRDGNRRPSEIVVRLESRPVNRGGGGGGGGQRGGAPPAGGGGPTAAGAGGGGTLGGGY